MIHVLTYSIHIHIHRMAFRWKQRLSYHDAIEIQRVCKNAIQLWGYETITSKEDYVSKTSLNSVLI